MYHNDERLSIDSESFDLLREQFDSVLNRTIGNMQMKGASEAVITMKMNVSTEKEQRNTPEGLQDFLIPKFKHDISSVMQVKDRVSGELVGDYQLVWDEEEKKYVMRKIDDGQTSLYDEEEPYGKFVDVDYEPAGLPSGGNQTERQREEALYEYLSQFVGEEMHITESMDNFTLRTKKDNKIVLSSAVFQDDPIYCDADVMAPYEDVALVCSSYADSDGTPDTITIETVDDENDVMLSVHTERYYSEPDAEEKEETDLEEAEEEYEYEEPEE